MHGTRSPALKRLRIYFLDAIASRSNSDSEALRLEFLKSLSYLIDECHIGRLTNSVYLPPHKR
jgi:hypothetical protein